jgi:hypothetical protein
MTHVQSVLDAHPKDPEGVAGAIAGTMPLCTATASFPLRPGDGVSAAAPTFLTSLN